MSNKKHIWDVIWQVVKFILTLGISHISKREERRKDEKINENNNE